MESMEKYKVLIYSVSNDYFIMGFLSMVFPHALQDLQDQDVSFPWLLTSTRDQILFP